MIRKIGSLVLLLLSIEIFAKGSLEVRVDPANPVINEPFNIIVEVNASGSEEPVVKFNTGKLKVISKDRVVAGQTTIIRNGQVTTKRVYEFVYEVMATKTGTHYLRNIRATIGDEKLKKMLYTFSVYKTPPKLKDLFVLAEVSKENIYLGEGIDVSYYVYASRRVRTSDPAPVEYPKFKDFIKRDYQRREGWENVRYRGEMFRRVRMFHHRLYPLKTGKLKIPQAKFKISVAKGRSVSPFGFFGGGYAQTVSKKIYSAVKKIDVLPVPSRGAPKRGFTGLIGKHKFELTFPRTKVVVNEPIEATLTVRGEGLLESFDAPELFDNPSIETFDKKATFAINEKSVGSKKFAYTYIAREGVTVPERELDIYYFDIDSMAYKKIGITVPKLEVVGSAGTSVSPANVSGSNQDKETTERMISQKAVIAPDFSVRKSHKSNTVYYVIGLLCLSLLYFVKRILVTRERKITLKGKYLKMIKEVKKGRIDYPFVYRFVTLLEEVEGPKTSASELLEVSNVDQKVKEYFKMLITTLEKSHYSDEKSTTVPFKKGHFVRLVEYVALNKKND